MTGCSPGKAKAIYAGLPYLHLSLPQQQTFEIFRTIFTRIPANMVKTSALSKKFCEFTVSQNYSSLHWQRKLESRNQNILRLRNTYAVAALATRSKIIVPCLSPNSTWLDSTRLDSTRHVRRVEPCILAVSTLSNSTARLARRARLCRATRRSRARLARLAN